MSEGDVAKRRNEVDWTRFGLAEDVRGSRHQPSKYTTIDDKEADSTNEHVRELFDEEQVGILTS